MNVTVQMEGLERAQRVLAAAKKSVDPVMRAALNTGATSVRREIYTNKMLRSYPSRQFVNRRIKVKRATRNFMNSKLIPSGSGIRVKDYRYWSFEPIDRTRARIFVSGPTGRKLAAGFVNPSGKKGSQPIATRSVRGKYRYEWGHVKDALGPSLAYWFVQMTNSQALRWTSRFLSQELEKRLFLEMNKIR